MTESFFDSTIRPQDDLFRHVNGTWLRDHEIPADRGRDGAFIELRDLAEEQVRAIIEEAGAGTLPGDDARKIGQIFASFMDTDAVEAAGVGALAPDLVPLAGAGTKRDLLVALGTLAASGVSGPFEAYASGDPNDPDRYVTFVWQGGLGLPDEAYYREDVHRDTRAAYVAHVGRMLALGGIVAEADAADGAERIMALETALAAGHWDVVATRDADATNNPMTFDEWAALAPNLDLDAWRDATGHARAFERLQVETPPFFATLDAVWQEASLADLRLWAQWHAIHDRAPFLGEAIVEENFDFYGRTLTGAEVNKDRWKRGVALVGSALAEAVGRIYVERHFPPTHKARMDHLVARLAQAYGNSIRTLPWMGEATRERALAKLAAFTPKIGYPDSWRDYAALETVDGDLLANVRAAHRFETARVLDRIDEPVDRAEWLMPPQMVNAYYMPTTNEIAFPAAILQPPFFDAEGDDAYNYGGIGAVIGHEMGHGFDDQGSKYGPTGKLDSWWTEEDRAEFEARTRALIAQYDSLVPAQLTGDDHHVSGALTIGENIGDLGGLAIALAAYELELAARGSSLNAEPEVDGRSAATRFFIGWARSWREKSRDETLIKQVSTDPHAPDEFRCNQVVRNLDAFHEAFATAPTDELWLDPAERVTIW